MILMIDGLKLAAGQALRPILGRWTSTPMRALVLDALITAVLRAYSAVTVALMRPLTRPLLRFLNGRFRTAEKDEAVGMMHTAVPWDSAYSVCDAEPRLETLEADYR